MADVIAEKPEESGPTDIIEAPVAVEAEEDDFRRRATFIAAGKLNCERHVSPCVHSLHET